MTDRLVVREGIAVSINREPSVDDSLSLDNIHGLLTARRRRYMLYSLYLYANPIRLPDVADRIVEWEHGIPGDELVDERLRTYNGLYHTHVPKLVDAGVIEYSQSEDMVELSHNAPRLRPYLERAAEVDVEENGTPSL